MLRPYFGFQSFRVGHDHDYEGLGEAQTSQAMPALVSPTLPVGVPSNYAVANITECPLHQCEFVTQVAREATDEHANPPEVGVHFEGNE